MASAEDKSAPPPLTPTLEDDLVPFFTTKVTRDKLAEAIRREDAERLVDLANLNETDLAETMERLAIDGKTLGPVLKTKLLGALTAIRPVKSFAGAVAGGSARPPVMRPVDKPPGKPASWTWYLNNTTAPNGQPLKLACTPEERGPAYVERALLGEGIVPMTFPITRPDSSIDHFHVRVAITEEITTTLVSLMGREDYDKWAVAAKIPKRA